MKRIPARSFRDLTVWQKAHQFVLLVYGYSRHFPKEELFTLNSQLRRAVISVPANTCEGFKRKGKNDKSRFLNISQGSREECRYYLILAEDLGYGDNSHLMSELEEISKMLESYNRAIAASPY
jgi:four helix bundle protein